MLTMPKKCLPMTGAVLPFEPGNSTHSPKLHMCYSHKTQDAMLTTLSWPPTNISDILDHQKQFVCFQQGAERYVAEKH